ncbi:hypothetical protein [Archangium lansingense]|uniref:Lipoprotein n=1 Tax=Archangium lansingense TaxID=2995310 RepID=A0ABT4ADI5_9BACT|nr:hypothetical protein [Archangium lansinium]MCY1079737.1 hypothetical protein [Archangium lansinium]
MKRLVLPALLALAATGCMRSRASLIKPDEEASKCELVQTLMREPVTQQLLSGLMADGREGPSQVLVFVRRPEESMLERLFAGEDPSCGGPHYKVVQQITTDAVVLFLQPRVGGYVYDVQRVAPDELSLGGEAKGAVMKSEAGTWVSSSI